MWGGSVKQAHVARVRRTRGRHHMLPDLTLRQRRGTLGAANDRDAMRVRRYDGAPAARRGAADMVPVGLGSTSPPAFRFPLAAAPTAAPGTLPDPDDDLYQSVTRARGGGVDMYESYSAPMASSGAL